MFDTILIANRGEIACRIIKTCRRMGIRTVAVYSEADAQALHVRLADAAIAIGPAPARESYLRADKIVAAAIASGAQAIHPGYGFLSERLDLIEACDKAGIVFIGPKASAIDAMGDKIRSKQIARDAGVPGVPGYDGADQAPEVLKREALRVGLPVMVKASAGGGGKGIRKVELESELDGAIVAAAREAQAAFGDGRLLIEKFVTRPRHVEVQVAGDRHGNLVHLFERDCSVQRSNQKLLEEAPAPNLRDETRAALHRHALTLSRAIGYDNLGTVEFLVDAATQDVFFLEMNTRLQVEHPVTEAITGLDLVEWQIRIAAGETLPLAQDEITCSGYAIEARLTAERAEEGFRPDTGAIRFWDAPADIRVDSGVATGSEVSPHYDSLVAKFIAHAPTRSEAVQRLAGGLERLTLLGPATTRRFLIEALRTPDFMTGKATTLFLGEVFPGGWQPGAIDEDRLNTVAGALWLALREQSGAHPAGPWGTLSGLRLLAPSGKPAVAHLSISVGNISTRVAFETQGSAFHAVGPSSSQTVQVRRTGDASHWSVSLDGTISVAAALMDGHGLLLRYGAFEGRVDIALAVDAVAAGRGASTDSGDTLRAPMPGTLASYAVAEGDMVEVGQVIAVLESMKLFLELKSPGAGAIARLGPAPGAMVAAGEILAVIDPA